MKFLIIILLLITLAILAFLFRMSYRMLKQVQKEQAIERKQQLKINKDARASEADHKNQNTKDKP